MPKNAHPPRGGGGKKPVPANPSDATTKDSGKKGKKPDNAKPEPGGSSKSKGKVKDAAQQPAAEEAPKKPDTRTLIGGASWTGKLPVNLLSEHCQKVKWEKPEYTMV